MGGPPATPGVAVVTGASSGIGEATALALAARGWRCVLLARRADRLEQVAAATGGEAVACDVGDPASVAAAAQTVLERHPEVALLVLNAGIAARVDPDDPDLGLVEEVMRVNYLGAVRTFHAFRAGLDRAVAARGRADVVAVSSVAGLVPTPASAPYSASKHALTAWTRSARATLAPRGIRVHAVHPGFVETEGFPQRALLRNPLTRPFVARPERVAAAIVRAVEQDRGDVVVPWWYRAAVLAEALAPQSVARLLAGRAGRTLKGGR